MKNNSIKGFTLIELLAIIVILAIIAVITVPVILGIIDDARLGAEKQSVIGYGKAVELAYTQYLYDISLGNNANHVATQAEVSASLSAGDGRVIALTINSGDTPINLKVDFEGDNVVCSPSDGLANSIVSGKVQLYGCSVNGSANVYNYSDGNVR